MRDPLLYKTITVDFIQKNVSDAAGIPIKDMLLKSYTPTARKREYVLARQISMSLTKKYCGSKMSLSAIGFKHNGYDHATVLHAVATVQNLLDTKDQLATDIYYEAVRLISEWNIVTKKRKAELVKFWINHKIPLHIRHRELEDMKHICPVCKNVKPYKNRQ